MQEDKTLTQSDLCAELLFIRFSPLPLIHMPCSQTPSRILPDTQDVRQIFFRGPSADNRFGETDFTVRPLQLVEQFSVLFTLRCESPEQIRPFIPCPFQLLQPSPAFDLLVVAAQQHFRHRSPLPDLRSGILRILEQPVPMALANVALRIGQNTRYETADCIRHCQRCDFSPGQHKITQGDFFVHTGFDEALIDSFIVAADKHEMIIIPLQPFRGFLRKGLSLR